MPILIKNNSVKEPILQSKTISPTGEGTWYYPDEGYDGFNSFTVQKRSAATTPTTGNATKAQVRYGKKFMSSGVLRTGTMQDVTPPFPSIETAFNEDNTKLTVTSKYSLAVGYVSSTGTNTATKTISIPESTHDTCTSLFKEGSVYEDFGGSGNHAVKIILSDSEAETISNKTLKYVFATSSYAPGTWGISADEPILSGISIDVSSNSAHLTSVYPLDTTGRVYASTISNITSSSNGVIYFENISTSSEHYIVLQFKGIAVAIKYNVILIYQ